MLRFLCFGSELHFIYILVLEFEKRERKWLASYTLSIKEVILGVNEFHLTKRSSIEVFFTPYLARKSRSRLKIVF